MFAGLPVIDREQLRHTGERDDGVARDRQRAFVQAHDDVAVAEETGPQAPIRIANDCFKGHRPRRGIGRGTDPHDFTEERFAAKCIDRHPDLL